MVKRRYMAGVMFLAALGVGGCQLMYLAGGPNKQKAVYKFSPKEKVMVLVDVADGVTVPPYFKTTLAEQIGAHLYQYKAIEHLVPQGSIVEMEMKDPAGFKKMGVADVAQAAGADAVLVVYLSKFATPTTTDGTVDEGHAELYVKVVDSKGSRLYGDERGTLVVSHADPALVSDRDVPTTVKGILQELTLKTGRMFHDYSLEDKNLHGHEMNPRLGGG